VDGRESDEKNIRPGMTGLSCLCNRDITTYVLDWHVWVEERENLKSTTKNLSDSNPYSNSGSIGTIFK
jgi:hypothetical protein